MLRSLVPMVMSHLGMGKKGKILGIGNLINYESPKLDNVLWVGSLTSYLISISQLLNKG